MVQIFKTSLDHGTCVTCIVLECSRMFEIFLDLSKLTLFVDGNYEDSYT